ncbi:MAG TPA: hypothetical protein ENF94_01060 [Candidatus Woesearchaeota archaeon]|nr:hypothetical protein [Candidatus Woesearchaeota archaeon]
MRDISKEIRRWNTDLDLDSLKNQKFVSFRSSSTTKVYPDGWYREEVRLGKLENGEEIIITVHEYSSVSKKANALQSEEWKEIKRYLKGKRLKDVL